MLIIGDIVCKVRFYADSLSGAAGSSALSTIVRLYTSFTTASTPFSPFLQYQSRHHTQHAGDESRLDDPDVA